jgi:hypothetical protein
MGCAVLSIASLPAQEVGGENILRHDEPPGGTYENAAAFGADVGFAAWVDTRNEELTEEDIYVQKVTSEGTPVWTENGLLLCDDPAEQFEPAITSDGMGGAVVAWRDHRAGSRGIHAQRISADGNVQWTANGQRVGGSDWLTQYTPNVHLAPDDTFLLTYGEDRSPSFDLEYWLVAQNIDGSGQRLWGENGISVMEGVRSMRSIPDGGGGLVGIGRIRGAEPTGFRIQRVLADQSIAWTEPVDISATLPVTPQFGYASDGQGGMVLAFIESTVVRAVRVTAEGERPWGDAGILIAETSVTTAEAPDVVPDGTGGAFISWIVSSPRDIHVQHVAADGSFLWPEEGAVVLYDAGGAERDMEMVSDGEGGLFFAWETSRGLHVHHVDSSGMIDWVSNGLRWTPGFDPRIGVGDLGLIVIYDNFTGLSARIVELPGSIRLRIIDLDLLSNQISFTLDGGMPETDYDILRGTRLGDSVWEHIGTLKPGGVRTETSQPMPSAFYIAREPAVD